MWTDNKVWAFIKWLQKKSPPDREIPPPPVRGLTEVCRQNGYCFISCAYSNVFLAGKFYITFPETGKKDN